jgi:predicted phosphoribosyltransferase
VAAPHGLVRVRPYCDEIATLATPHDFYGVSVYCAGFRQITDADVAALLRSGAPALR